MWPGLTIHRCAHPTRRQAIVTHGLALGIPVAKTTRFSVGGGRYDCVPDEFMLFGGNLKADFTLADATADEPGVLVLIELPPAMVSSVAPAPMRGRGRASSSASGVSAWAVSELDAELADVVARLLRSMRSASDRRVLAPLFQRELAYRIVRREGMARIVRHAVDNPVSTVLAHIGTHLAEPLAVADLAARANLSTSAFSRTFRAVTGISPYQYVKRMRLERARDLLADGDLSVEDTARAVGYRSTSHFIKAFRVRFGTTPRSFARIGHA